MFNKQRDIITHPQVKCMTGTCEFKKACKQNYKWCNEHTGFISPCFSCKKADGCKIYIISCKTQKPIMNCKYWIKEGV